MGPAWDCMGPVVPTRGSRGALVVSPCQFTRSEPRPVRAVRDDHVWSLGAVRRPLTFVAVTHSPPRQVLSPRPPVSARGAGVGLGLGFRIVSGFVSGFGLGFRSSAGMGSGQVQGWGQVKCRDGVRRRVRVSLDYCMTKALRCRHRPINTGQPH